MAVSSELQVRRLKLRELRVLLAAVQAGSMAKAAKQLAISQPAVSRAIDDLEKTLGVPLFDRTARGIEPTQYGRALLRRGVAVFDELKQRVQEIAHLAHNEFLSVLTTTSPVIPQLLTCEWTSIGDA